MIVFGLTGSIGMGKSTAAAMLKRMRVPVHDSDAEVRFQLSSHGQAFEEVAVTFPECWDKKHHLIRRNILADIVFNDSRQREVLESILHPYVRMAQQQFIKTARIFGQNKVVLDIPLLYETGAQGRVDHVIVVTAPHFIQRQRVLSRPNIDEELFEKILQTQVPDATKRAMADYVVHTGLGHAHTYNGLKKIIEGV